MTFEFDQIDLMNFIGGEFVPPHSGDYFENWEPATGKVFNRVPDSSEIDMVLAIQSAKKAFEKWSAQSIQERSEILLKVAKLIDSHQDVLAKAESRDVGKPLWLAKQVDIPRAAENFRFFATRAPHFIGQSSHFPDGSLNYTSHRPLGVAGLISPWNLPLYLLTWKIAPALAMGNVAVCKPSEVTPTTAYLLGKILNEAGVPPGVCNIVLGKGQPAGQTLVTHPSVPLISFTGGTETGAKISELAAPHFKKLSLELGGKNATLILKDADLKKHLPLIVRSSFLNSGQICLCGSRILVHESREQELIDLLVPELEKLKLGDPEDPETFMGPLSSLGHLEKVEAAVKKATDDQAKILTGGKRRSFEGKLKDGYFFEPTLLSDLSFCSDLHQSEIFGPVVTIQSFKYVHEAVKWANNTPYGLAATIWTQDLSKAHKIAAQLDVGTVWVNTWMKRDLRMPFGGAKASGLGREGGDESFQFYTEEKTICIQV